MTAVKCNPHYDEKKGRVTKGNGICHSGWKEKGRFELKHTKITPNTDDKATMWMMSLKSAKMYVIDIDVKGYNAIPQVTIHFVDVRGKTLFESPSNSPYKTFFHLPWPIFYLTIKLYQVL